MKQLVTLSDFEGLKKGDKIHVSNGQPEPPKHHTKKHRSWSFRNYTGFVYDHGPSCGRYEINVAPKMGSMIVNCYSINSCTFSVEENEVSA